MEEDKADEEKQQEEEEVEEEDEEKGAWTRRTGDQEQEKRGIREQGRVEGGR